MVDPMVDPIVVPQHGQRESGFTIGFTIGNETINLFHRHSDNVSQYAMYMFSFHSR
jgi:hypothetical protein